MGTVAHGDMLRPLAQDEISVAHSFEKKIEVRRMQVQPSTHLQRHPDCRENRDELVIINMLAEVKRGSHIECPNIALAERYDILAVQFVAPHTEFRCAPLCGSNK